MLTRFFVWYDQLVGITRFITFLGFIILPLVILTNISPISGVALGIVILILRKSYLGKSLNSKQ